jgi:hypothetical protein
MTGQSREKPRVVAEMNASAGAAEIVRTAISYCQEHDAELVIVWVIDPDLFGSTRPGETGAIGTWGPLSAPELALRLARGTGVAARAVVRIGERSRVLEEERQALGAEKVFTAADVPVVRCPVCDARYDPRGVHSCPRAHLGQAETGHTESHGAVRVSRGARRGRRRAATPRAPRP